MKRIAILFITLATVFTACQHELTFDNVGTGGGNPQPNTNYYIKFKLDGRAFDYRESVVAVKATIPPPLNVKTINVNGRPGTAAQPLVAVDVRDVVDIVVNRTYDETVVGATFSSLLFRDSTGDNYSSALTLLASGFECRFSEITATYVKGIFKGKVANITGGTKNITEGEFFARIF
jgi:hypothetical protein